jgi:hypothetical protein
MGLQGPVADFALSVATASFVPSGDSAMPSMQVPAGVAGTGSLVIVSRTPVPAPVARTRYQVRDSVSAPAAADGTRPASATNVRSSSAPVIPTKLRPRGGCSVNSVFPDSVAPSSRPTGFATSPRGWSNVR